MLTAEILGLLAGPPLWLKLGELRWEVRFDHRTLLRLEKATGVDVLGGGFDVLRPCARSLRSLIQTTMRPLQDGEVIPWGQLIPSVVRRLLEGFQTAWVRDMPLPEPKGKSPHPGVDEPPWTWMEAWANAREILRLTDEEWLAYTPRMVQTLSRLRREVIRQNEFMLAQIAANIVNFSPHPPKSPTKPESLMLHPWDLPETKQPPQTVEGVLRMFRNFDGMDLAGKLAIDSLIN